MVIFLTLYYSQSVPSSYAFYVNHVGLCSVKPIHVQICQKLPVETKSVCIPHYKCINAGFYSLKLNC